MAHFMLGTGDEGKEGEMDKDDLTPAFPTCARTRPRLLHLTVAAREASRGRAGRLRRWQWW